MLISDPQQLQLTRATKNTYRFDVADVAGYSNRTLGWRYTFTALWGSQAGPLLLWMWLLFHHSVTSCRCTVLFRHLE